MLDALKNIFKSKRKLIAVFIDETGTVTRKKKKYSGNLFEDSDGIGKPKGSYIVDHNFTVYEGKTNLPMAFYYKNNPQPIPIKHARNLEADAIGFQHILDSKAIQDLFSNKGMDAIFWCIVVSAAGCLLTMVVLAIQTGIIKVAHPAGG